MQNASTTSGRGRFLGAYTLKYNITDFLNFEAKYAFEYSPTDYTTYNPYDTYTRSVEIRSIHRATIMLKVKIHLLQKCPDNGQLQ